MASFQLDKFHKAAKTWILSEKLYDGSWAVLRVWTRDADNIPCEWVAHNYFPNGDYYEWGNYCFNLQSALDAFNLKVQRHGKAVKVS